VLRDGAEAACLAAAPAVWLTAGLLRRHRWPRRVYERGIALFKYPHVKDIWASYLTQVGACSQQRRTGKGPPVSCTAPWLHATRPRTPCPLNNTPPPSHPQFVARYGGKKVERARDLFRQAIDEAPPEECKPLFLAYARYEEQHGLARNAMQVGAQAQPTGSGAGCGCGGCTRGGMPQCRSEPQAPPLLPSGVRRRRAQGAGGGAAVGV
jgi:hypothetical protein